ncbi:MAG: MogA/MoaB family molybdenum cofactor biosynthesis protein [Desulfovibrio sp.]|jgi:molybdenum cofactor synthesis domain-containing protein|nr:MogA/MoaB family molybdenum cofactor biosynthesis protein [Desulfovibrio sp.]
MQLTLRPAPCAKGIFLPLFPFGYSSPAGFSAHRLLRPSGPVPRLPAGAQLLDTDGKALFAVTGMLRPPANPHALVCPLLTALEDAAAETPADLRLSVYKPGVSLAWITLSDKGYHGDREDASGPLIAEILSKTLPIRHSQGFLLPDDADMLRALLTGLALTEGYDIVCTTGGTGLSPRDISPQATAKVIDLPLPGVRQAMLAGSLAVTPRAAISRAEAGILGKSIIINLPGSRKAVQENLNAVIHALPHALDKLHGDGRDCGG